jgi:iron complex outermembrane receptor protein
MLKFFTLQIAVVLMLLSTVASAQNITISGTVTDKLSKEPLPGASITVKGKIAGTSTNESGRFTFTVAETPPFTVVVSFIGYQSVEQQITSAASNLVIELDPQGILGQELVVSASRTPERILESPVSIERVGTLAIRESAAPSFYDGIANLKGAEVSTQSMTFKSVNTRGFNSNGNTRFNQFIDGMDNQAPGLNFSVGNIVGISDLDADNVELLPGASSALYGAGGTNGTLLMTSKSPFQYQGLSMMFKTGINHVDGFERSQSPWQDMSLRYAKAWNDKFAFKVNVSYLQAQDWQGQDYTNFNRIGQKVKAGDRTDPAYDGINIYGDEINTTFGATGGLLNGQTVSRTGYMEKDLVNYNTKSFRTSSSINYRITDKIEAIAQANYGVGTSVYTGLDRYSLNNFHMGQYKLELKGANFFLRGYTTQEGSGDAYNATALGTLINEYWKQSTTWFTQYAQAYNGARLGAFPGGAQADAQAHLTARAIADGGRPVAGSAAFNALKELVSRTIGPAGGAKFNDKSSLYHTEGMYNFTSALNNAVEFLMGASFRRSKLNSGGTIFDDAVNPIFINEYGAYTQIGKKVTDMLKLTGSIRYDKNENFKGQFTPRVSGVLTVAKDNNIRASYQTGFRNPTNQNMFIDLQVRPGTRVIGGLPGPLNKYNLNTNKGYTLASFQQFVAGGGTNPALLQQYTFGEFKPESVQAYEVGYKGLINSKLLIDAYYYYNSYKNFISTLTLVQNPTPANPAGLANPLIFQTAVNNTAKVNSQGWAVGLDYPVSKFNLSGNVSYNKINNKNPTFVDEYNTPKVRYNLGVGNRDLFKNIGFNVSYRWQGEYLWQSSFATGTVPAFGTVDGQISFKIPSYKSIIKIGGSDLLNKYYRTSMGNPTVGGMYYVSLLFDQFLR